MTSTREAGPALDRGLIPTGKTHGSYWDANAPALANLGAVIAGVPAPYPAAG